MNTINEVFAGLNARLFYLSDLKHVVYKGQRHNIDFEPYLEKIKTDIFRFPIDEALAWLDSTLLKIEELQEAGIALVDNMAFHHKDHPSIELTEEEAEEVRVFYFMNIEDELSIYYYHLDVIKDRLLLDKESIKSLKPIDGVDALERLLIRTNLSVDELVMGFKIFNEYDTADPKKILQRYKVKRDLHRTVVASFTTVGADHLSLKSYETKYNSTDQIAAVDFWIKKFATLRMAAVNLKRELERKPDKAANKRKLNQ